MNDEKPLTKKRQKAKERYQEYLRSGECFDDFMHYCKFKDSEEKSKSDDFSMLTY